VYIGDESRTVGGDVLVVMTEGWQRV